MPAQPGSTQIGFVGLGIMGAPMARNLAAAGFDVTVYNRTPAKAEALFAHAGEPKKLSVIEGAGHGFRAPEHRTKATAALVGWFERHLTAR